MNLNLKYDKEASSILEKIIFSCDNYELCREDLIDLKQKKILKFVKGEDFPKTFQCQVMVQCETYKDVKIIFFNPNKQLPKEIFNEPILNKDLISSS